MADRGIGKQLLNVLGNGSIDLGDTSEYKTPFLVSWKKDGLVTGQIVFYTEVYGLETRVPNGTIDLTAGVDDQGNPLEQVLLHSRGRIRAEVSGFTGSLQMLVA